MRNTPITNRVVNSALFFNALSFAFLIILLMSNGIPIHYFFNGFMGIYGCLWVL